MLDYTLKIFRDKNLAVYIHNITKGRTHYENASKISGYMFDQLEYSGCIYMRHVCAAD